MIRIANLPIFRRLFLAFFLAALIPGIVIIVITSIFVHALNAQGIGNSQTTPILIGAIIAALITIFIVVTIGFFVNITITQPLRHLSDLTRRIAKGDTSARAVIATRDEISMVASSMNNMLDNIVLLIQQAQAQRDSLLRQVEKLVSEVSGVGEGDLRIQAEVTSDALGVMADSFNYMVEELSGLVIRVKRVSHEVENSTVETYDRMSQLVKNADMQIEQIARATVEVERMAASSRQVAERAERLYNVARETRQTAQSGRETVQQTVNGIERIQENVQETASKVQILGERSQEINNIVDVISNIAHQTNRLALDASIQAAMAGANGKGFLAIAEDIRRLAERSKEQARQITQIVRGVREDIGAVTVSIHDTQRETLVGTQLAQTVDSSLQSLFGVVERQAQEIDIINQLSTQQFQSSRAVAQIMQTVTLSTRQTSTSTHDVSQNMERLGRLAEQLLASVEAFKVNGDTMWDFSMGTPMETSDALNGNSSDDAWSSSGSFRTVTGTAQGIPATPSQGVDASYYSLPAQIPTSLPRAI